MVCERGLKSGRLTIDRELSRWVERVALKVGHPCQRGTLACCSGPGYETSTEVRFLQGIGADLVTMSSAPEIAFAARLGMRVAVVGAITNPGTGIGQSRHGILDHAEVLEAMSRMSGGLSRLIAELFSSYADETQFGG